MMRVLIVDDETRRYGRLISAFKEIGIEREQIDIVPSAEDARDKLLEVRYELLILDILLSLRPEDEPDVKNSLNLLMELHEGDDYHKPIQILGITGDMSIAGESAKKFAEWTWYVLKYSATDDEWVNRAVNCAKYVLEHDRQVGADRPKYGLDLAIVCALERPELQEVLKLPWHWEAARPLDDRQFIHEGYFELDGKKITVAAASAPRMGMVSTSLLSAKIIEALRPRLIAMCGICAGVRGKVELGDVLLADPAWDFQSGKRVFDKEDYTFAIAPHQLSVAQIVRGHVEQLRSDSGALAKIASDFESAPRLPRIHIGPVASGSAVLADGKIIEEIKAQHRELLGVEMEIYGLYAAAASASAPAPTAFALKAVCDFADSNKADDVQRFAAYTSARVLANLMERFGSRLLKSGE